MTSTGQVATSDIGARIRDKLIKWTFFGVIFAIFPIFANMLSGVTRSSSPGFDGLLGRGELLLISAAVAAASAGELFGRDEIRMKSARLLLVSFSVLLIGISSYWYADVAAGIQAHQQIDAHAVAVGSLIVFVLTCVVGACCVIVSELR